MAVTVEDLVLAFPTLADRRPEDILTRPSLLACSMTSIVGNYSHALKIAAVVLANINGDLYCYTPCAQRPYRATVDLFLRHVTSKTGDSYLRAIARATDQLGRGPGAFRRSLVSQARMYDLQIPTDLVTTTGTNFEKTIRVRLTEPECNEIAARAEAGGFVHSRNRKPNISAYVRYCIFDKE